MFSLVSLSQIVAISVMTVLLTCLIFYEIMYLIWTKIDKLKFSHRFKVFFIVIVIFFAHTICVWFYGIVYYLMAACGLGGITLGNHVSGDINFAEYIYFSASTYSSLGFGDVLPQKEIRFLAGVEALNGLVLIAWSASYTYLSMEKFWDVRKKGK